MSFRDGLVRLTQISESDLAAKAALYLSGEQLRSLTAFDFEIGNHTYTHVHCRALLEDELAGEIDQNKALLETISGQKVRSFSVPYGSSADLTTDLVSHLHRRGYQAVFLAESRANSPRPDWSRLDRVSIMTGSNATLFSEIEVLPRLRTIREWLFGTLNLGYRRSNTDLETVNPTVWPCAPREGAKTGAAVPSGNP